MEIGVNVVRGRGEGPSDFPSFVKRGRGGRTPGTLPHQPPLTKGRKRMYRSPSYGHFLTGTLSLNRITM